MDVRPPNDHWTEIWRRPDGRCIQYRIIGSFECQECEMPIGDFEEKEVVIASLHFGVNDTKYCCDQCVTGRDREMAIKQDITPEPSGRANQAPVPAGPPIEPVPVLATGENAFSHPPPKYEQSLAQCAYVGVRGVFRGKQCDKLVSNKDDKFCKKHAVYGNVDVTKGVQMKSNLIGDAAQFVIHLESESVRNQQPPDNLDNYDEFVNQCKCIVIDNQVEISMMMLNVIDEYIMVDAKHVYHYDDVKRLWCLETFALYAADILMRLNIRYGALIDWFEKCSQGISLGMAGNLADMKKRAERSRKRYCTIRGGREIAGQLLERMDKVGDYVMDPPDLIACKGRDGTPVVIEMNGVNKCKIRIRTYEDMCTVEMPVYAPNIYETGYPIVDMRWIGPNFFQRICLKWDGVRYVYDPRMEWLLQIFLGSGLVGRKSIKLGIFMGHGRNGKSTILDIMKRILGGYYKKMMADYVSQGKASDTGMNPAIHAIDRKRFVVAEEISSKIANLDMFKQVTGNEDVEVRGFHRDVGNVNVAGVTMAMTTNDRTLQIASCANSSILERFFTLNFYASFTGKDDSGGEDGRTFKADTKFLEKIDEHLNDFFAWLLMGCCGFYHHNFDIKDFVFEECKVTLNSILDNGNKLHDFVTACYDINEKARNTKHGTQAKDILNRYNGWFISTYNSTPPLSRGGANSFYNDLRASYSHLHYEFQHTSRYCLIPKVVVSPASFSIMVT